MFLSIKKIAKRKSIVASTSLYTHSQPLQLHIFSISAALLTLIATCLPLQASAKPDGFKQIRERDRDQFEACFNSQFGSDEEAQNCTTWFAQSACDGTYLDNRGDVESFTAQENLISYLKNAEIRTHNIKPCNEMGIKRLKMSILLRDKNADKKSQTNRLQDILNGFNKLSPEQRRDFCETIAELPLFEPLLADPKSKKSLLLCMDGIDPTSKSQIGMIARFESANPKTLSDDARAALIAEDMRTQKYETAKNRLQSLDIKKLSQTSRDELLKSLAPLGYSLFKHSALDSAIPFATAFPIPKKLEEQYTLDLIDALIGQKNATIAWYCEQEAGLLLPRGEYDRVVKHTAQLVKASPKSSETTKYLKKLIEHATKYHYTDLLYALVIELDQLDENTKENIAKSVGQLLTTPLIEHIAANNTKSRKIDISDTKRNVTMLRALLNLTRDHANTQTTVALGSALIMSNETKDGLKYLYKAIESNHAELAQEAWYKLIITLRNNNNKAEAKSQYEQFETKYPASPWLRAL